MGVVERIINPSMRYLLRSAVLHRHAYFELSYALEGLTCTRKVRDICGVVSRFRDLSGRCYRKEQKRRSSQNRGPELEAYEIELFNG